jgi:ATP-dependent Zn protease
MGGCMKKCDKIEPSNIKEDDYSINYCLQFGFCGESLANICKVMDEKGETSKNSLLNQYCSLRKSKKTSSQPSQPSQKTQVKQEHTQEPKKLKSTSNNNIHFNSNESYSNNIGVFSVIIILVLIGIFMVNSKK